MTSGAQDSAAKAREYEKSVLAYEKLDQQVDDLLSSRGGHSDNLTDEDYVRYRELAELRDLAYNRMKTLERSLLDDV
ncbi:MAG: hypothetical protein IT324_16945 [Anaerolineae bacterium]|nr:hypothetical protein [Anaerolineae bacterium]